MLTKSGNSSNLTQELRRSLELDRRPYLSSTLLRARSMFMRWPTRVTPKSR